MLHIATVHDDAAGVGLRTADGGELVAGETAALSLNAQPLAEGCNSSWKEYPTYTEAVLVDRNELLLASSLRRKGSAQPVIARTVPFVLTGFLRSGRCGPSCCDGGPSSPMIR